MSFVFRLRQIGIGAEMDVDRLKDVASEPHDFNIYLASNVTMLSRDIATRLTDALCNSKHQRCAWEWHSQWEGMGMLEAIPARLQ